MDYQIEIKNSVFGQATEKSFIGIVPILWRYNINNVYSRIYIIELIAH